MDKRSQRAAFNSAQRFFSVQMRRLEDFEKGLSAKIELLQGGRHRELPARIGSEHGTGHRLWLHVANTLMIRNIHNMLF